MSVALPVVAIVGRPNVGKSTLFNRLAGRRIAIVDDAPGVTRDRNFARADWLGHTFFVVDTGGVIEGSDEPMDRMVREQAMAAVEEADLILFVVDTREGVHPMDERIAGVLRTADRPIVLVANKVDRLPSEMPGYHEFWSLGIGEPFPVSAVSGRGTGDLLDRVIEDLPEIEDAGPEEGIRVAVVGKPNVGKSSLVNRLFGEERVVVSDQAGTTRDPVDAPLQYHGERLVFVDTAGLRRQSRVKDSLEYYSALRTARVVRQADVCLVLVDATEGLTSQDVKVAETAWEAGCGVVMVVNKWDLVEKDTQTAPRFQKLAGQRIPFLKWVPFLFISALTGQRARRTLDLILEVQAERHRRIETHEVNDALSQAVGRQPPPHARGRAVKLKYATQAAVAPPTFVIFANLPKDVPAPYVRYLENSFRARWGFIGVPMRLRVRESSAP